MDTIELNGVKYVRACATGRRAVVVVDRGWIFAGDISESGGRITLTRAVWVFRWERIGFASVVENPKQDGVDIRPLSTAIDLPAGAELFRLPVSDDWGL